MAILNKRVSRRTESARQLPPGQHRTADFSIPQAGPTPRTDLGRWRCTIRNRVGGQHGWAWPSSTTYTLP